MSTSATRRIAIASNQGEIGGGEVMLLAIARAARDLGHDVTVVGPAAPSHVLDLARRDGFSTVAIPGRTARSYLRHLRKWDADHRDGLLWCNGLRPAFATSGRPDRIVHLHQRPSRTQLPFVAAARRAALTTLVPSAYLASEIAGAQTFWNWTGALESFREPTGRVALRPGPDAPLRIGYIGRLSHGKGVPVLCAAVKSLIEAGENVDLLLAGEARFVTDEEAEAVERSISSLGPAAIRRGWMPREEFFASVDLAVFPSTLPESFGLVATEAMAARCPFVVSRTGAFPEVVGEDYPYLVRPNDAEALAEALRRALIDDWSTQLDQSHARWAAHFTEDAGRERVAAVLAQVERREATS